MKLNNRIGRPLHIAIVIALAVIGTITGLVAKGQLEIAGPIMALLAIVTSVLHSVDPIAANGEIPVTTVRPPPPPAAQRRVLVPGMLLILAFVGCTQPLFPTLTKIEQVVLNDIVAGKSRDQVELDVEAAMGLTGPIPVLVNLAIDAAITLLESGGYIPQGLLGRAHAMQLMEKQILSKSGQGVGCK